MSRTKVVCTIGPASRDRATLARMIEAGMDVARLNMSHGNYEEHAKAFHTIRELSAEAGRPIAILQDLSGSKIRLGQLAEPVALSPDDEVVFTTEDLIGEGNLLPIQHPDFVNEVAIGDEFSMADGVIVLRATEKIGNIRLRARVISGETDISSHKGVNIPHGGANLPDLTDQDIEDLKFGAELDFDWIALSFVRSARAAGRARAILDDAGVSTPLLAKIEKPQALDHIDTIAEAFDGIMVARGDLGIEVPLERVPGIQKDVIRRANARAKPVITATQMLLSMVWAPRPTRAEVTDVTSAILDGTDAVMLSEETAVGAYAVRAVQTIGRISTEAESLRSRRFLRADPDRIPLAIPESVARATHALAHLVGATLIIVPTASGGTARLIAATRPAAPILALSSSMQTVRRLCLSWGVVPRHIPNIANTDELFEICRREAIDSGMARTGDRVVITSGVPFNEPGTTSLMRVLEL